LQPNVLEEIMETTARDLLTKLSAGLVAAVLLVFAAACGGGSSLSMTPGPRHG
jgi:NADH:ubiquinone oxidoreductase subunit F (NADH-binding)